MTKELISQLLTSLSASKTYHHGSPMVPFKKEWPNLIHAENLTLSVCTAHLFKITSGLRYPHFLDLDDDLYVTRIYLGVRDNTWEYRKKHIELGIHKGYLFINDLRDFERISAEDLINGIELILTVKPGENGRSQVLLSAVNENGSILSQISSDRCLAADWNGRISPGAHFKYIRIEGIHPSY